MKRFCLFLFVSLMMAMVTVSIGCGKSEKTLGEDGLKLINEDAVRGAYLYLDTIRGDQDLAQISDSFVDSFEVKELSDFSINPSQIDYIAVQAQGSDRQAIVALGQFDFRNIRDSLKGLGFTQGEYDGIEFWRGYHSTYGQRAMAIFNNGLIWGDVEAAKSIIRTINNKDPSFYELPAVKEMLDRLPEWTPLILMVSLDPLSDFDIPNAEVAATAMAKKNKDIMKISMIVNFIDEADALQICESIQGQENTSGECDGKLAVLEIEMPIEDFGGWFTSTPTFAPSDDWYESLVWIRQNTPDPFQDANVFDGYPPCTIPEQDYNYPESAYWIMSWWDYGCRIIDIAERLPNAVDTDKGAADAALFFTAQDEVSATHILDSLGSKYVIIDNAMAMGWQGKFYAMAILAGKDESEFFDVFYKTGEVNQTKTLTPIVLYYPKYYQSMCSRLYNFGGEAWIPSQSTAVSWKQEWVTDNSGKRSQIKIISDMKTFNNYYEVKSFVSANPDYIILGSDQFDSPVPLEKLEHYKLIHKSPTIVLQKLDKTISAVAVFQYVP